MMNRSKSQLFSAYSTSLSKNIPHRSRIDLVENSLELESLLLTSVEVLPKKSIIRGIIYESWSLCLGILREKLSINNKYFWPEIEEKLEILIESDYHYWISKVKNEKNDLKASQICNNLACTKYATLDLLTEIRIKNQVIKDPLKACLESFQNKCICRTLGTTVDICTFLRIFLKLWKEGKGIMDSDRSFQYFNDFFSLYFIATNSVSMRLRFRNNHTLVTEETDKMMGELIAIYILYIVKHFLEKNTTTSHKGPLIASNAQERKEDYSSSDLNKLKNNETYPISQHLYEYMLVDSMNKLSIFFISIQFDILSVFRIIISLTTVLFIQLGSVNGESTSGTISEQKYLHPQIITQNIFWDKVVHILKFTLTKAGILDISLEPHGKDKANFNARKVLTLIHEWADKKLAFSPL